jgi:hypothetical protein
MGEVLREIEAHTRRLARTRAADAALASAGAAAMAFCAMQLAWATAPRWPAAAWVLCALAPAGAATLLWRAVRRRLGLCDFEAAICGGVAVAVALVSGPVAIGLWGGAPVAVSALAVVPAAGALAAAWAYRRAPGTAEVARMLDARWHSRERLATAVELESCGDEGPWSAAVRSQAQAVLSANKGAGRWPGAMASRASVLALAAVLLCAAAMAGRSPVSWDVEQLRRLSERAAALSDEQRREAAESLERSAAGASDPELAEALSRAARAMSAGDLAAFREQLARAQRAMLSREAVAVVIELPSSLGGENASGTSAVATTASVGWSGTGASGGGQGVYVYDPRYEASAGGGGDGPRVLPTMGFDEAWSRARMSAGESAQRLPAPYRQMVLRYFGPRTGQQD